MIEYKYSKEHYIYDKNRNAIKNWLLNPPTKHHEMLLDMAGFECSNNVAFDVAFDHCYYEDVVEMNKDCCKDLNIDEKESYCTFSYLLMALSRFLVPSERLKMYKIHLKKIELSGDFTTK